MTLEIHNLFVLIWENRSLINCVPQQLMVDRHIPYSSDHSMGYTIYPILTHSKIMLLAVYPVVFRIYV